MKVKAVYFPGTIYLDEYDNLSIRCLCKNWSDGPRWAKILLRYGLNDGYIALYTS